MARITELMNRMVPISSFSRGGTAKAFDMVNDGKPVLVLRKNNPIAVIITPEEYDRLTDAADRLQKLEVRGVRAV